MKEACSTLTLPNRQLAYQQHPARGSEKSPVLFLGGYGSDMTGTKASFLAENCAAEGRGFLRFDYRGHGQSSATFLEGTIGDWLDDARAILEHLTQGPQLLVGSSMGGWIGLLLAQAAPQRVAGFIGIAAAPDFTEALIMPSLTPRQRAELAQAGVTYDENAPPDFRLPLTQKLLDEAKNHLILHKKIEIPGPVHLLQGKNDLDVPWQHSLRLLEQLDTPEAHLTLIRNGDHRLSRPEDLDRLWHVVATLR